MPINYGLNPGPRRILFHAVDGFGKSTLAAKARSIIFPTEPSLDDIDCASFGEFPGDVIKSYEQFIAYGTELYETGGFPAMTIDTVDWLAKLVDAKTCQTHNVSELEQIPYGKGPTFTLPFWGEIIAMLDAIRRRWQMHIILLCHTKIEKFSSPSTPSYDRYTPSLQKDVSPIIREWCTEVLFGNYKVYTTSTDMGFNRKEVKGIGDSERMLYTTYKPSHVAKNRLGLPDEMPFGLDAWDQLSEYFPPVPAQV